MTESLWTSSGATRLGKINSSKREQPDGATQAVYGDSELERGLVPQWRSSKRAEVCPREVDQAPATMLTARASRKDCSLAWGIQCLGTGR